MPAANLPPLVSPSTPSSLEINFRRLMAKCDAKIRSSDKILQGSERTKYIMNIRMLRELLSNLENELNQGSKQDVTQFKEYIQKIDDLENALEGSTSIQPNNRSITQPRLIPSSVRAIGEKVGPFGSDIEMELRLAPGVDQTVQPVSPQSQYHQPSNKEELLGLRERRKGGSSGLNDDNYRTEDSRTSDFGSVSREQNKVEASLQNDRAQREEMLAGMSRFTQQIRQNAMALQQTLADERKSGLLDDADQALDNNISRLSKERARLELYSKQSRKTKWLILGIVLGVSVVFVLMFFIIRIF